MQLGLLLNLILALAMKSVYRSCPLHRSFSITGHNAKYVRLLELGRCSYRSTHSVFKLVHIRQRNFVCKK